MRFLRSSVLLGAIALGARNLPAQALEALWYSTDTETSVQSFLANAEHVSIVSPQCSPWTASA